MKIEFLKKIYCLSLLVTLLFLLSIPTFAKVEDPDGNLYTTIHKNGDEKEFNVVVFSESEENMLKQMQILGPSGEYFTSGLLMYGYEPTNTEFPSSLSFYCELTDASGNCYEKGKAYYTQLGIKFAKISKSSYEGKVEMAPMTLSASITHWLFDGTTFSKGKSESKQLVFDEPIGVKASSFLHYTLDDGYLENLNMDFSFHLEESVKNIPSGGYSATYHSKTNGEAYNYYDERRQEIRFQYVLNHYSILYYGDGSVENIPLSQTKWFGKSLTLSGEEPRKEGYTFLGWSTSPNGKQMEDVQYAKGAIYTKNASLILYPVFQKNVVLMQYMANGGVGAPAAEEKQMGVGYIISSVEPKRDGYTFLGWTKEKDDYEGKIYKAGDIYEEDENTTFFALWEDNRVKYHIALDACGGVLDISDLTLYDGERGNLPEVEPIKDGYVFLGWDEDKNALLPTYYPGDEVLVKKDTTLYAIYREKVIHITYQMEGGIGGPNNGSYQYLDTYRIPTEKPILDGKEFLYWQCRDEIFYPGDVLLLERSLCLVAIYRDATKDTYISSVSITPAVPQDEEVTAQIFFSSNTDFKEPIPYEIYLDGVLLEENYVELKENKETKIEVPLGILPEGNHTIYVSLRKTEAITEIEKDNNFYTFSFSILKERQLELTPLDQGLSLKSGDMRIFPFLLENLGYTNFYGMEDVEIIFSLQGSESGTIYFQKETLGLVLPSLEDTYLSFVCMVPDTLEPLVATCEITYEGVVLVSTKNTYSFVNNQGYTQSGETQTVGCLTPVEKREDTILYYEWTYDGEFAKSKAIVKSSLTATSGNTIKAGEYTKGTLSLSLTSSEEDFEFAQNIFGKILLPIENYSTLDGQYIPVEFKKIEEGNYETNFEIPVPVTVSDGDYVPYCELELVTKGGILRLCIPISGIQVKGSVYDDWYLSLR